jgi:hypothetical protein
MLVEILYFPGCPHHAAARDLVARVAAELGMSPEVRMIEVESADMAERLRFIGSPTIRVSGHDIEPDAHDRTAYTLACRVYRSDTGVSGIPEPRLLRAALIGNRSSE